MNGPRKNARNAMRKNARKTRNVKENVKTLAIFARMAELLPVSILFGNHVILQSLTLFLPGEG